METGKTNENENNDLKKFQEIFDNMQKQIDDLKKSKDKPADGAFTKDDVSALLEGIDKRKEVLSSRTYVRQDEIDEADYDKNGKVFFAYSVGLAIVDDMRMGRPVLTPFGNVIFFSYQATQKKQVGKYQETSTYCAYVSHSLKEQEWLRKHKSYGIRFFERAAQAMKVDARMAQHLSKHVNMLDRLDANNLIGKCRQFNIEVSEDLQQMRLQLAYKYAEADMANETKANESMAINAMKESENPELMKVK